MCISWWAISRYRPSKNLSIPKYRDQTNVTLICSHVSFRSLLRKKDPHEKKKWAARSLIKCIAQHTRASLPRLVHIFSQYLHFSWTYGNERAFENCDSDTLQCALAEAPFYLRQKWIFRIMIELQFTLNPKIKPYFQLEIRWFDGNSLPLVKNKCGKCAEANESEAMNQVSRQWVLQAI